MIKNVEVSFFVKRIETHLQSKCSTVVGVKKKGRTQCRKLPALCGVVGVKEP